MSDDIEIQKLFNSALIKHQKRNFDEAEGIYKKILEHVPQHSMVLYLLGTLKAQLNNHDQAIILINKSPGIAVHPGAGNYSNTIVNGLLHKYKNNLL